LRQPPPPRCPRCDVPLGTGHPAGAACLECAGWPEILVSARAAVIMEPPADALVHALKYEGWRPLGELMGRRMADVCSPPVGESLVIPIPTTSRRRRMRGYNQAQVLAEVVARKLGVPMVEALDRHKGGTQVRLGPRERRSNVQGSFRVIPSLCSRIRGTEVILIDDVLTTGSTALSAAAALEEEGAASVSVATFARALPFGVEGTRAPTG
jgi:ComF family protein